MQGRRRLRRGEVQSAIQAFHKALAHRPSRFRTLVDLSIAYLCARDVPQAQAALGHARRSDPSRFTVRAGRLLGRWGFELPRSQVPPRPQPMQMAGVVEAPEARSRTVTSQSLPYGDCRNLDEYARFRAMPPITQAEIDELDWDRVIGDFFEE
ncbi:MAG: hypothetical protein QNJ98_19745 [Planctomycetota bacterium]|nr:hypothetical protein [Planctomycetota bacterium]